MRPGLAQFATGDLYHLHALQGSAYTAGGQVGRDWGWRGFVAFGFVLVSFLL